MRTAGARLKTLFGLCLYLASGITASAADLKIAGIFADGMVLQRGVRASVWGWGSPGADVAVEFAGQRQSARVDGDGNWRLNLAPMTASSAGSELRVLSGDTAVVFKDVLVGEVWLCSGQSNIQRNLTESDTGVQAVAQTEYPTIRFVVVPHQRAAAGQDGFTLSPGSWRPVNKSNLTVSAVGFFFARRLQQTLGVPVGLIISAWEGTGITTWIPDDGLPGSSNEDKTRGRTFNAKINSLIPLAIKGVVWYQGEENHGMGMRYSDSLTGMARAWRKRWGRDLPFLIVMLAPHTYEGVPEKFPSEKGKLPEFWMAQLDAARRLKNAEVACTVDVGNARNDIHPRQKEPVGERLALAALKLCYGASNSAPGPVVKSVGFDGKAASVTFGNVAQGLRLTGDAGGCEIAGVDKKYAPAKAALAGKDVVILRTDAVAVPAYVRYAWSNTPGWSVFNSEGLPAIPFSTEWNAAHDNLAADKPERTTDLTRSPFGIGSCHACNWGAPANAEWIPQMAAIGVTNHRCCNTAWPAVEPAEGKWTWDVLDKQMGYLEDQRIAFGGILAGSPQWNTKDKPGTLPVNNLQAWSRYVTEVVKHCKGRIKYWEVWNEPPNGTGPDQTAADYAKIVVAAYDAAKAADPDCMVGIAAKSVAINYLDQALAAGAKGHFDYITLHPYESAGCTITHPGSEVVYLQIHGTVRKMLAARDSARIDCPIIFTELGTAAGGEYGHEIANFSAPEVQGHALVKYYAMGIAQGITCIQWFEGRDGDSGPMGLLDAKGVPRPAYTALAQMLKHFGPQPTYLGWVLLNDKHYGFVFQGAKGTVLATWSSSLATDKIEFGQEVEIVEPLTGKAARATTHELTVAPILVLGVPDKVVKLARDNKAKPFTWGGDYTGAKSVSVTFGEKNVEKGLHTKSAESVAKDVIAYGGSARSGGVPGGNVLMVDPNFLSYTATPIEISIVLRRNEANDNSGFKLVYESTNGYKDLGWYTVPDNKKWHTVKWKITDAQFVGMWGFNFLLNSDGNTFNKYLIQSVTVTRLDK